MTLDCHAGTTAGSRPGRTRLGRGRAQEAEGAQGRVGRQAKVMGRGIQDGERGLEQESYKETGLRMECQTEGVRAAERSSKADPLPSHPHRA